MKYHVNGDLVPADEATVSVRDRGFAYGDAAFETLRAYGGDVFRWDDHAARLGETCEILGLDHGIADADLRERIWETLVTNNLDDAYVRLSITRGVQPGKLAPKPAVEPTVVIVVKELPRGGVRGTPVWDEPATAAVVETRRPRAAAVPARAKTHNYLDGILARRELDDEDEALLLDDAGALTEGATSNLFFVSDGVLRTPNLDGPVLPGITRSAVVDLAADEGIPAETGRYDPAALHAADEAFLTNSTWELRPLTAVDSTQLGSGPVTERLAAAFDERIEADHY